MRFNGVFRNHHHGPHVAAAVLIGVGFGVLEQLYGPLHRFLFPRVGAYPNWNPFIACLCAIALLVLLRKDCPHQRWRFATGAVTAALAFSAMILFDPFNGAPQPTVGELASMVGIAWILAGSIGGLLALGMFRLRDLLFGTPIIQDGSLCPQCGYIISGLPEARCPECGRAFSADDIDLNRPPASRAWRRIGMVTASGLFVAGIIYLSFPRLLITGLFANVVNGELAGTYLELRPAASARIFAGYLADDDAGTRAEAAYELMWFPLWPTGTSETLSRLALSDPDPMVRRMAIQTIGRVNPETLESLMADLLKDPIPDCRWGALAAALPYGSGVTELQEWAVPYLIGALDDPEVKTCRFVHRRLINVTGQTFPFTPRGSRKQRLAEQAVWQDWWNRRTTGEGGE